jgi:hypothetical protein
MNLMPDTVWSKLRKDAYPPGERLLVLFSTDLYRIIDGRPSRRVTRVYTGDVVTVVSDAGGDRGLRVEREARDYAKGRVYDAHRADFVPVPEPFLVAHAVSAEQRNANLLAEAWAEVAALKQQLAAVTES